jgi:hypothetical protein
MPPAVPGTAALAPAAFARNEEPAPDRHVFNMANGVPSLPPAGEHAYSKTKL